jgi:hypothetical protein
MGRKIVTDSCQFARSHAFAFAQMNAARKILYNTSVKLLETARKQAAAQGVTEGMCTMT